jgi:hypothetical protein
MKSQQSTTKVEYQSIVMWLKICAKGTHILEFEKGRLTT